MRVPLHYSIRNRYGRHEIIAVTTERGGHWWGRTLPDNIGTHGANYDLRGRFETVEAAQAVFDKIKYVADHYAEQRRALDLAERRLRQSEQDHIKRILQGDWSPVVETVRTEFSDMVEPGSGTPPSDLECRRRDRCVYPLCKC